jgi:hypothetical protein
MNITFIGFDVRTKQPSIVIDGKLTINIDPSQFSQLVDYLNNDTVVQTTSSNVDEDGLTQFSGSDYFYVNKEEVKQEVFSPGVSYPESDTELEEAKDDGFIE